MKFDYLGLFDWRYKASVGRLIRLVTNRLALERFCMCNMFICFIDMERF